MSMKQFITVLVAALFAAASLTAVAQEKKSEQGMEKPKAAKSDKAKKPKAAKTAKTANKKKPVKKGEANKEEMKK